MELNNEISINLQQPQEFHLQLYWGGMNETITLSQCALQRGVSYKVGTAEQSLYSEMPEAVVILESVKAIIRFSLSHVDI